MYVHKNRNRLGAHPRFGHDQDNKIVVFQPFPNEPYIKFVNVDTTSKDGILRAAKLGLAASRKADMSEWALRWYCDGCHYSVAAD